ncbi:MAG: Holliday junction branch migration protein RuvA [Armatimonadetes bacterium]|nr:Holliday junction branch migration protein RuvA [Armatimonadota bacterium]
MISRLSGKLIDRFENKVIVDVGGIGYEVWMPGAVLKLLNDKVEGDAIDLVTLYYLQIDTSKAVPVLIGFLNELQKEFFEKLLTVPKMGPKLAMGAFSQPMSHLAQAIEQGNAHFLRSLPGVGTQKAKDIIATLQGKVAKYALFKEGPEGPSAPVVRSDAAEDALQMLVMLGHRRTEAEQMVQEVLRAGAEPADAEELVRLIYKRQQSRELAELEVNE